VVSKPTDVPESEVSGIVLTFGVDTDSNPTSFSASGTGAENYFATTGSSTWSFAGSSTTNIALSGVTPVTSLTVVGDITATSLTVSFTLTTQRTAILDGNYTLTLTK
jgi:hypothetical protein